MLGAKHSPPAHMSTGRATILEQMMQRHLLLDMQKRSQTNKAMMQRSFTLPTTCNIMAGCCEQFSISSGYQSIMQKNGPTTCNAASKRKARSEGPRPRGLSGALREKNCFWTSDFHSGMHPATGFQNLTHLRRSENHRYSLALAILASIFAHTF